MVDHSNAQMAIGDVQSGTEAQARSANLPAGGDVPPSQPKGPNVESAGVQYNQFNVAQSVHFVIGANAELMKNTMEVLHRFRQEELESVVISRHEQIMAGMEGEYESHVSNGMPCAFS